MIMRIRKVQPSKGSTTVVGEPRNNIDLQSLILREFDDLS